jgi:hypothetical protein
MISSEVTTVVIEENVIDNKTEPDTQIHSED